MADAATAQHLTFTLGRYVFAVDILRVLELRRFTAITPLPASPPYVRGVLNLRGTIIPVVDLRRRFGMPSRPYHKHTVLMVVEVHGKLTALIVDAVTDVVSLPADGVQRSPDLVRGAEADLVSGLAVAGDGVIVLLDLDRLFADAPAGVGALP